MAAAEYGPLPGGARALGDLMHEALAVDGYAGEQLDPFGAVTTRVASIRARTSGRDTLPGGASPVRHVSVARARTRKQHDPEPQRAVRAAGHVVTTRRTRGSSSG
jgi:hypothetical protein